MRHTLSRGGKACEPKLVPSTAARTTPSPFHDIVDLHLAELAIAAFFLRFELANQARHFCSAKSISVQVSPVFRRFTNSSLVSVGNGSDATSFITL